MTLDHLRTAMENADLGNLNFNMGINRSFRYGKKWYPLRATVNNAMGIAGLPNDLTTDRCLLVLIELLGLVRIDEIEFNDMTSVGILPQEIIEEAKLLAEDLQRITH